MKAYGVVRKPKPTYSVVEHVFKIEMVNPKVLNISFRKMKKSQSEETIEMFQYIQLRENQCTSQLLNYNHHECLLHLEDTGFLGPTSLEVLRKIKK